jgi:hypothetical protein
MGGGAGVMGGGAGFGVRFFGGGGSGGGGGGGGGAGGGGTQLKKCLLKNSRHIMPIMIDPVGGPTTH